jgi:hypothetical protein
MDTGFIVHKIISAVKGVECVSDMMPCTILRGRWCHTIYLNVHAPTKDKTNDAKDTYEEWNVCSENPLSSIKKDSDRRFQCQSRQGRHF